MVEIHIYYIFLNKALQQIYCYIILSLYINQQQCHIYEVTNLFELLYLSLNIYLKKLCCITNYFMF